MNLQSVALISGQSLLLEGVGSRLRDHADEIELEILSPQDEDFLGRLMAAQPDVIVLDISDPRARQACPLMELFRMVPEVKIVLLDSERSDFQVVTSRRRQIESAEALFEELLKVV